VSSMSVIHLLEPIGSARTQEFRVRGPFELASHNLYLTLPQRMCHPVAVCGTRGSAALAVQVQLDLAGVFPGHI